MTTTLAFDPGYGNVKLYGSKGGFVMPSALSVGGSPTIRRMTGLRTAKPPLCIQTDGGIFHVGEKAHDWGLPVESLDFDRLTHSPEMLALFLGSMTRYGVPSDPVTLMVGLPVLSLMGDSAKSTQEAVRNALRATHSWHGDGVHYTMDVRLARITSQPVGAMFDYLLSEEGDMLPQ